MPAEGPPAHAEIRSPSGGCRSIWLQMLTAFGGVLAGYDGATDLPNWDR
jgi:hypothetical protein